MILTAIAVISIVSIAFFLGWIIGRKKFSNDTAVKVIKNLEDTLRLHVASHEQKMAEISKKYTDLKFDVIHLIEENLLLKKEIEKLKEANRKM